MRSYYSSNNFLTGNKSCSNPAPLGMNSFNTCPQPSHLNTGMASGTSSGAMMTNLDTFLTTNTCVNNLPPQDLHFKVSAFFRSICEFNARSSGEFIMNTFFMVFNFFKSS